MFNKIVVFVALILVLGATLNGVNAVEQSTQYCTNTTDLYTEIAIYNEQTGGLNHYNWTTICGDGCFKSKCLIAEAHTYDMSIVIGLMLVAIFFAFVGLKLDKEVHGVIQVLFLFVGMLFVIITMAVISELADYSGIEALEAAVDSGYQLSIYVFWFVLFWFIILLIYKLLVMTGKIQPLNWSL